MLRLDSVLYVTVCRVDGRLLARERAKQAAQHSHRDIALLSPLDVDCTAPPINSLEESVRYSITCNCVLWGRMTHSGTLPLGGGVKVGMSLLCCQGSAISTSWNFH